MTWMVEGMAGMGLRVTVARITGTLLALGAFNHSVITTLETLFGIRYGSPVGWGDWIGDFFAAGTSSAASDS